MALIFNGSTDKLLITDSADFDFGGNDFTMCWWEYRTATTTSRAVFARDEVSIFSHFLLGLYSAGSLLVYCSSNGINWDVISGLSLGAASVNSWSHYMLTRSGSTFNTYKDGAFIATANSATAFPATANSLSIGHVQNTHWFPGWLFDLRIYNGTAQSTNNIKSIYEGRGSDGITTNLVLRMKFDEKAEGVTSSAASDFIDVSPKNQTPVTLGGTPTFGASPFIEG